MTERDLLWPILADPDDDLPRLALADWLDENGQSERAEFVRVQCALASWKRYSPPPDVAEIAGSGRLYSHAARGFIKEQSLAHDDRRDALRRRERELRPRQPLEGVFYGLQERFGGDGGAWEWHRGFIGSVSLSLADWKNYGAQIVACQPVITCNLTDARIDLIDETGYGWHILGAGNDPFRVPGWFATEELLREAISDNAIDWARTEATSLGLVPECVWGKIAEPPSALTL